MSRDYRQELTDRIVEALANGAAPWQKPWEGTMPMMPFNPVSGTTYRGGNVIALMMRGYEDPRWCTYKQAEERGWQVRKGERATLIEFWKFHDDVERVDPQSGEKEKVGGARERPIVRYANVFNVAQMDNVPALEHGGQGFDWEPAEIAERILGQAGVPIYHDQADRAFYSVVRDEIHLPPRASFGDAMRYYGTALHELGHATGHPKRLDRDIGHPFGSEPYAKEELRAEMASLFLSYRLGVPFDVGQHAAYVHSWIKVLKEDKHELFRAARDAEQITEYVMGLGREQAREAGAARGGVDERAGGVTHVGRTSGDGGAEAGRTPLDVPFREKEAAKKLGARWDRRTKEWYAPVDADLEKLAKWLPKREAPATEQRGETVTYTVAATRNRESRDFADPDEAAKAYHAIDANDRPSVYRVVHGPHTGPGGRAQVIATSTGHGAAGQPVIYGKSVSDADPAFSRAYRALTGQSVGQPDRDRPSRKSSPLPTSEKGASAEEAPASRINLNVPYADKEEAKRLGAKWDKDRNTWYVAANVDRKLFEKWMEAPRELTKVDIKRQFADALRNAGLVVDGEPEMDGEWHRTTVTTSSKTKALKGVYIGHLDDLDAKVPNGYIENFDTGYKGPWFPEGLILSDEQRQQFQQQAAENRRVREQELAAEREKVAARCSKKWHGMADADDTHPYLDRKQVGAFGLKVQGDRLVQALRDADGKIWSLQYIPADSSQIKLYEKGGQKTGNFHVLGEFHAADAVLFGEGYATCASLHMATGLPVVEVFDSGNIEPVLAALKPRLEGKTLVICGDDDVLTPERILKTLNSVVRAEHAQEKLQVAEIRPDEAIIDGQRRPLAGNPKCFMRLAYRTGPEGVQRVVGEFDNEETGAHMPILVHNAGREKALAAAVAHEAATVFPAFCTLDGGPSDFNDLHVREGLDVVRRQLAPALEQSRATTMRPAVAAKEYSAMHEAEAAFTAALVHAYGEANAGEMRYQSRHEEPAVGAAAAAFRESTEAWHAAVRAERAAAQASEVAALQSATPEQVAKRALGETAVVVPPSTTGRYVGPVLGNTERHAVQDVGRSTAVAHDLAQLDRVPVVGQRARIEYQQGRGIVQEATRPRAAQTHER